MVSNLKTKLATAVLLAMTLIALSIPVMATVCQYGGDEVATDCTIDTEDVCVPDTETPIDEAPVCDDAGDVEEEAPPTDDCEAVEETCGPVTINVADSECTQDVDACEDAAEDDACDTIAEDDCGDAEDSDETECGTVTEEEDPCADEETADQCPAVCNGSKTYTPICNGSQTYSCPKVTTHKPPCVPGMED